MSKAQHVQKLTIPPGIPSQSFREAQEWREKCMIIIQCFVKVEHLLPTTMPSVKWNTKTFFPPFIISWAVAVFSFSVHLWKISMLFSPPFMYELWRRQRRDAREKAWSVQNYVTGIKLRLNFLKHPKALWLATRFELICFVESFNNSTLLIW